MDHFRIVMLAPFGIRPKGTLLARMLPLAQALVQRGHRVVIVAPPVYNPQDAGTHSIYRGVLVIHTTRPTLPGLAGVMQQVALLWQAARQFGPDLLHLFKPKGYSGLAALLERMLPSRLPLVVDTDDWEGRGGWNDLLPYPPTARALFAWQEQDLPRRAQAVTVASRTLESQVWGFGVSPEQVFYLPNGIDRARLSDEPPGERTYNSDTVLLYTRFWEFDVYALVETLIMLVQQHPAVRLLVVGKGERHEEQTLLRLAQRTGIATAIDYRGWVDPPLLPELFAQAAAALVPMDDTLINRARCSAKLLELLAAGVPVVAARVGQVEQYIEHRVSGWLVPPGKPAAMAQAMVYLLQQPALQQQLAAQALQAIRSYTWDALAPTAEKAYEYATR